MFRFTIRDMLWLTAIVAVLLFLGLEFCRARQRQLELMTCIPNTTPPWPHYPPWPPER